MRRLVWALLVLLSVGCGTSDEPEPEMCAAEEVATGERVVLGYCGRDGGSIEWRFEPVCYVFADEEYGDSEFILYTYDACFDETEHWLDEGALLSTDLTRVADFARTDTSSPDDFEHCYWADAPGACTENIDCAQPFNGYTFQECVEGCCVGERDRCTNHRECRKTEWLGELWQGEFCVDGRCVACGDFEGQDYGCTGNRVCDENNECVAEAE